MLFKKRLRSGYPVRIDQSSHGVASTKRASPWDDLTIWTRTLILSYASLRGQKFELVNPVGNRAIFFPAVDGCNVPIPHTIKTAVGSVKQSGAGPERPASHLPRLLLSSESCDSLCGSSAAAPCFYRKWTEREMDFVLPSPLLSVLPPARK